MLNNCGWEAVPHCSTILQCSKLVEDKSSFVNPSLLANRPLGDSCSAMIKSNKIP
jgi:hypothetical protein